MTNGVHDSISGEREAPTQKKGGGPMDGGLGSGVEVLEPERKRFVWEGMGQEQT